jgi:hypothetical protein
LLDGVEAVTNGQRGRGVNHLALAADVPSAVPLVARIGHRDIAAGFHAIRHKSRVLAVLQPDGKPGVGPEDDLREDDGRGPIKLNERVDQFAILGGSAGGDDLVKCLGLWWWRLGIEARQVAAVEICGNMGDAAAAIPAMQLAPIVGVEILLGQR